MAELPSISDSEETFKMTSSRLQCSICLESFKEPKLLPCFHTYCKSPCLETLLAQDPEGQSLTCPKCENVVSLPEDGVAGLQTDYQAERGLEIRGLLETAEETTCQNCEEFTPTALCLQCKIVMCKLCTMTHQQWGDFKNHKIVAPDEVRAKPRKYACTDESSKCKKHNLDASLYCETCNDLICSDCTIGVHSGHLTESAEEIVSNHKRELVENLKILKTNRDVNDHALSSFSARANEINNQIAVIEANIHNEIEELRKLLDQREMDLVADLNIQVREKQMELDSQRKLIDNIQEKISSCLEYAEASLKTGTESEILKMKAPVLKRIKEITAEVNPDTLQPKTEADIELVIADRDPTHKACREFGEVICDPPTYCATGDGMKFATPGKLASVEVHTKCKQAVDVKIELVHAKTFEVKRENGRHTISYQPVNRGRHSLHIRVNGRHIQGSPYSIAVAPSLESLCRPAKVVDLNEPHQAITNSKGQIVVGDLSSSKLLVMTYEGEILHELSEPRFQYKKQNGVAVDKDSNIYVSDSENNRILKFDSKGIFLVDVGCSGSNELEFDAPLGICYSKTNNLLYVCDRDNHRIQVLTTDLKFVKCFGGRGNENGQFQCPSCAAVDDSSNLYVVDCFNNQVQVFTAHGEFLRMFFMKRGEETLNKPCGLAIDSCSIVYVSETEQNCISMFTPNGDFIGSFGEMGKEEGQFDRIRGLHVDSNNSLFVSDAGNDRLQIFCFS